MELIKLNNIKLRINVKQIKFKYLNNFKIIKKSKYILIKHNHSKMVLTLYKNSFKSNNINITGIKSTANFNDLISLFKLNNMTILKFTIDNTFFQIKKKINLFKYFITFCHNIDGYTINYKLYFISVHLNYFNCVYMKFGYGTLNIFENTTLVMGFKNHKNIILAVTYWEELLEQFEKYCFENHLN